MSKVCIVMGSKSDEELAKKAEAVLKENNVEYETHVISAHRNPDKLDELIQSTDSDVFIAIAGLSAALPGVIASKTEKVVIGVPKDAKLGGMDALLSIVQMPPGVPVACVGIDNAKNAAYLAMRVLGIRKK